MAGLRHKSRHKGLAEISRSINFRQGAPPFPRDGTLIRDRQCEIQDFISTTKTPLSDAQCPTRDSDALNLQNFERSCGRELVVVAIKPTCLAGQRILRSENPTSTQNREGPANSTGHAGLPALRRVYPLGPAPPASEALAGADATLGDINRCLERVGSGQPL
jgi:hypothetical protein